MQAVQVCFDWWHNISSLQLDKLDHVGSIFQLNSWLRWLRWLRWLHLISPHFFQPSNVVWAQWAVRNAAGFGSPSPVQPLGAVLNGMDMGWTWDGDGMDDGP